MIRLFALRLLVIFIVIAGLASLEGLIDGDPEHVKPPKAGRPDAGVHLGTPAPPAVTGADPHATGELVLVVAYLDQIEQERQAREEQERIAAYLTGIAEETARMEAERQARARQSNPAAPRSTSGSVGDCTAVAAVVGTGTVAHESGGNPLAENGIYKGCAQIGLPWWNGACAGLDWHNVDDQATCARIVMERQGPSAWAGTYSQ